jgi:hypothetical protein
LKEPGETMGAELETRGRFYFAHRVLVTRRLEPQWASEPLNVRVVCAWLGRYFVLFVIFRLFGQVKYAIGRKGISGD